MIFLKLFEILLRFLDDSFQILSRFFPDSCELSGRFLNEIL